MFEMGDFVPPTGEDAAPNGILRSTTLSSAIPGIPWLNTGSIGNGTRAKRQAPGREYGGGGGGAGCGGLFCEKMEI